MGEGWYTENGEDGRVMEIRPGEVRSRRDCIRNGFIPGEELVWGDGGMTKPNVEFCARNFAEEEARLEQGDGFGMET